MSIVAIKQDPKVITYLTIRRAIGFLGFCLPFILVFGTGFFDDCSNIQDSISHYYYTVMGDVFVGLVVAISLFLIAYKGYDKGDALLTNLAGLFGILMALLPTGSNDDVQCTFITIPPNALRQQAHILSAAIFLLLLAIISYFQFTKTSGIVTPEKRVRNRIYKACGIIIVVSMVLIFVFDKWRVFPHFAFWLEWIALASFGTSWLTKGKLISPDP